MMLDAKTAVIASLRIWRNRRFVLLGLLLTPALARAGWTQRLRPGCGVERWRVKVALDADVARIDTTPVMSSISALGALGRSPVLPHASRIAPHELSVFHIAAILRERRFEADGDVHLVLEDFNDPGHTMIAEVPDSACVLGSPWAHAYAVAKRRSEVIALGETVDVVGIGFFDFPHGQRGAAPNLFELHPVLAIGPIADSLWVKAPGRAAAGDTARSAAQSAEKTTSKIKVWVNSASNVYHCSGTRWYGATKRGMYMTEAEARAAGARPAYGRNCGG